MERKFDISDFVDTITEASITEKLIKRVKLRRKELKYTQKELAKRSGVNYASIRRFETTGDISLASLIKIAHAMNCLEDFNNLFKYEQITNLKDYKLWLKN